MVLKVVIDETKKLSEFEARLASILEFVADDAERGVIYVFSEWTDRVSASESEKFKPHLPRIVYLSKREYLENGGKWKAPDGRFPAHVPTNELIYSNSEIVRKGALEQQGLNATTALLLLAASGIDIAWSGQALCDNPVKLLSSVRQRLLRSPSG
jgi:hypothetical protein